MVNELIGFDARLKRELYTEEWPDERRKAFLLNPSVVWPYSVDTAVWPSIFDDPAASSLRIDPLHRILLPPDPNDQRQKFIGLWTASSRLKEAVHKSQVLERVVCIAVELVSENGYRRDPDWKVRLSGLPDCEQLQPGNETAGYDVADIGFTSGLSNCGWPDRDEVHLKRKWAKLINDHGLLCNLDAAIDFRAEMDARAPEHAPFFVYRILTCPW